MHICPTQRFLYNELYIYICKFFQKFQKLYICIFIYIAVFFLVVVNGSRSGAEMTISEIHPTLMSSISELKRSQDLGLVPLSRPVHGLCNAPNTNKNENFTKKLYPIKHYTFSKNFICPPHQLASAKRRLLSPNVGCYRTIAQHKYYSEKVEIRGYSKHPKLLKSTQQSWRTSCLKFPRISAPERLLFLDFSTTIKKHIINIQRGEIRQSILDGLGYN